jgi:hypothetical protein
MAIFLKSLLKGVIVEDFIIISIFIKTRSNEYWLKVSIKSCISYRLLVCLATCLGAVIRC